jgi:hypothetical protein
MFGYDIVKNGNKLQREHKKYKKIAEKYAKFSWEFGFFQLDDMKFPSGHWRDMELENACDELDKLQFKYNTLLYIAKYYNNDVENDVNALINDLKNVKCNER